MRLTAVKLALVGGLLACGPAPLFLEAPSGDDGFRWYAVREGQQKSWWVAALDFEAGPVELPPESSVFVFEYASDPGLPRGRPLARDDFQTASCLADRPSKVLEAHPQGPVGWLDTELPTAVQRILDSLPRNECLRCVRFDEEAVEFLEPPEHIYSLAMLGSGTALVSSSAAGLQHVIPGQGSAPISGCAASFSWLESFGGANEFLAVSGSRLLRGTLDVDAGRCSTTTSTVVPSAGFIKLAASAPEDPFEVFLLAREAFAGLDQAVGRVVYRYTGDRLERLLEFELDAPSETDLVRLGPGEALFSTGIERVVHLKDGAQREIMLERTLEISGLWRADAQLTLAFTGSIAKDSMARRYSAARGAFEALGGLDDRSRSAARFRDGFVIVTRTGSIHEHRNERFCPVSTSLGNRSNHAPRFLHAGPADSILVDTAVDQLSWLHPRPPDPPDELEF